jgi:hypothetical protein
MNHVLAQQILLALGGFAPDVDWGPTLMLLGIMALLLIGIGAVGAVVLAPYIGGSAGALLDRVASLLNVRPEQVPDRVAWLVERLKHMGREIEPLPPATERERALLAAVASSLNVRQEDAPARVAGLVERLTNAEREMARLQHLLAEKRPVDHNTVNALIAQREALIAGCVKVRGLLDDDIAADVLNDAMRRAGVTVSGATPGTPKDPRRHFIHHTVPAPDPQSDGLVQETLAPGWSDNDKVLRPADVVVYKWAPR